MSQPLLCPSCGSPSVQLLPPANPSQGPYNLCQSCGAAWFPGSRRVYSGGYRRAVNAVIVTLAIVVFVGGLLAFYLLSSSAPPAEQSPVPGLRHDVERGRAKTGTHSRKRQRPVPAQESDTAKPNQTV